MVILGRVAGIPLDLETLPVESVVPEPLRAVPTADEFLRRLPEFDAHFERLKAEAAQAGEVLRYVGVVDANGASGVQLRRYVQGRGGRLWGWGEAEGLLGHMWMESPRPHLCPPLFPSSPSRSPLFPTAHAPFRYPTSHPFAALQGGANVVAFTTTRYPAPSPLVIQGAGAGAAVTAMGVFGDILRVAQSLR